ncbi:MAG: hypothetical protein EP329_28305 [Deltaproteobacteria bacterium]|nr:MAG: hypothetical protein EP329_28305 [Deltaproteobacteria bacterium]
MALNHGTDFLFFTKVDMSKQSLTATMSRGCAVCTRDHIYFVPVQSMGSVVVATISTKYSIGAGDPVAAIGQLLEREDLTLDALHAQVTTWFGEDKTRWIFPLAEAEKFTYKTGFFGMTTLKMPGESVRRMVIRDKGGKKAAKAFYDAAAAA